MFRLHLRQVVLSFHNWNNKYTSSENHRSPIIQDLCIKMSQTTSLITRSLITQIIKRRLRSVCGLRVEDATFGPQKLTTEDKPGFPCALQIAIPLRHSLPLEERTLCMAESYCSCILISRSSPQMTFTNTRITPRTAPPKLLLKRHALHRDLQLDIMPVPQAL